MPNGVLEPTLKTAIGSYNEDLIGIGSWNQNRIGNWELNPFGSWELNPFGSWYLDRIGSWELNQIGSWEAWLDRVAP
jgi:hypothetical protein